MPRLQDVERRRRLCLDQTCDWSDKTDPDEIEAGHGCAAHEINAGAFDHDEFVHVRQWDDCPYFKWLGQQEDEHSAEQRSQDEQAERG